MKIKFIVPKEHEHFHPSNSLSGARVFPPVGLARMAGYAGSIAHVSLVDERVDPASHDLSTDIAVIFINTYNRTRAYQLAKHYKTNGAFVVLTGPLLNHEPEQACQYADCIFIGAGDELMPQFLEDYCNGRKRRLYVCTEVTDQGRSAQLGPRRTVLSLAS